MSQQFCLKWNNHMNNMMDVFKSLLSTESMVDVTLACDGRSLKAHKMVLSACSPFFQSLFLENPCKHPIVILKDMKYTELKAIVEFMYHGEVNVAQDQLSALMKTAETLRVKGLAEVTNEKNTQSNSQDEPSHRSVPRTDTPPPPNKRRRGRTRKRSLSDSNRSDEDSNEPKIKQPMSPDIEEISGDVTMDVSSSQFSNLQTPVSVQTSSHSSTSYHKASSVISQDPQIEEPTTADEDDFGVEPTKLLEQTFTTEELNRRNKSNIDTPRRFRSSTDHTIVPTSMSSDTSYQQPNSPPDIKPEVLDLEPPMSPAAGTSHSNDNAMMMYMDQSNSSHPGPSGYQENTALVSQDSQPQDDLLSNIKVEPKEPDSSIIFKMKDLKPSENSKECKKPYMKKCHLCGKLFDLKWKFCRHISEHKRNKKSHDHSFQKSDKTVETNKVIDGNKDPSSVKYYDEIVCSSTQSKNLLSNISNQIVSDDDVVACQESYEIARTSAQSKGLISNLSNQIKSDNSAIANAKESSIKDIMPIKTENSECKIACSSAQSKNLIPNISNEIASCDGVLTSARESFINDVTPIKKENLECEIDCTSTQNKDLLSNINKQIVTDDSIPVSTSESFIRGMPVKKETSIVRLLAPVFRAKTRC